MTVTEMKKKACDIRSDVVTLVHNAGCGHIGGDMSEIEALVALYYKHMNVSPEKQADPIVTVSCFPKGTRLKRCIASLRIRGILTRMSL